jgi:hypothetical protein
VDYLREPLIFFFGGGKARGRTGGRLASYAIAVASVGCGGDAPHERVVRGSVAVQTGEGRVKVIHYTASRVANPNRRGDTTYAEFEEVRQGIIATCRQFGVTGPDAGPDGRSENPAYYVVDDQYNSELYQYAEVYERAALSKAWVSAVMRTLASHTGWGVGIKNIKNGYLLIFADRLMVTGPAFAGSNDLAAVAAAASRNLVGVRGERA